MTAPGPDPATAAEMAIEIVELRKQSAELSRLHYKLAGFLAVPKHKIKGPKGWTANDLLDELIKLCEGQEATVEMLNTANARLIAKMDEAGVEHD